MQADYRSVSPEQIAAVRVVPRAALVFPPVAQAARLSPVGSIERIVGAEDVELVVTHVEARP